MGNPINLPLPAGLGNFAGVEPRARGARRRRLRGGGEGLRYVERGFNGTYTRGVVNGQVFGPTLIPTPPGATGSLGLIDLAASPAGGYLLLFQSSAGNPSRDTLFAQELDAKGVPRGAAVALAASGRPAIQPSGIAADAASLPNGRWIVFTWRRQRDPAPSCSRAPGGTVLAGE